MCDASIPLSAIYLGFLCAQGGMCSLVHPYLILLVLWLVPADVITRSWPLPTFKLKPV
jgi:hypothetical protein